MFYKTWLAACGCRGAVQRSNASFSLLQWQLVQCVINWINWGPLGVYRSDLTSETLSDLCLLSDMWRLLLFLSLCLISPQIFDPWTSENVIAIVCFVIPHPTLPLIHSLTHIPGHEFLSLFVHCSVLCSSPILHLNTTAPSSKPFKPHCDGGFHFSVTSILFVPPPWWSVFPRFCPAFYSAAPLTSAGIIPIMQSLCPDGQRDEFGFLQYKNSTWVHLRSVSDFSSLDD